ncbi:MAG: alanine racemase [Lachnospiraceae bacterium]|nr:alanine racemase [Lachnospiraceae bacterium]
MQAGFERVYAEIDLNRVRQNLVSVSKNMTAGLSGRKQEFVCVVKADAYGHGAAAIARFIEEEVAEDGVRAHGETVPVWGFAVATAEEGIELRLAGICKPVLLLGFVPASRYAEMIEYGIRIPLFEAERIRAFDQAAESLGKKGLFHVAVDTGMSRIGLTPDERGLETVREALACPHVEAEGIFTHLATADMPDNAGSFVQIERFRSFVKLLQENGIDIPFKHYANSAATVYGMYRNDSDLCRLGISLYGLPASEAIAAETPEVKPVMSLYSQVMYVKDVPAGTPVGYGALFVTDRPSRIATVSVGYADGYPRGLSNKADVLIRGVRCPVVGRVCMDIIMVDVTKLGLGSRNPVREEDRVTLIGRDGDEEITVCELASLADRFYYELPCLITKRVPRVYIRKIEEQDSKKS